MPDQSQHSRARQRESNIATSEQKQLLDNMIEWATVAGVSSGDGEAPTADTDDDDDLTVLESYGFSSRPEGGGTTIAVAPGGEVQGRVALGVSSPGGRPVTDAGDTVVWCVAGHTILLDNDGGVTITAKDGQVVELDDAGDITVTTPINSSVTINVSGTGAVNLGGLGAAELTKIADLLTVLTNACNVAITAGAPVPPLGDSGAVAFTAFLGVLTANLVSTAGTTKAKGE